MKNRFIKSVIVTIFFFSGWHSGFSQKNTAFQNGEELLFKVSYGFFDAAEAKMVVNKEISTINDIPTYKIDVYGQTLGVFKLFYVKDNWGSYIDTAKMIPYNSYRHIEEGRYRKHERVTFDHKKKNAHVKLYDRDNQNVIDTKDYKIPSDVQDIVSGFYFLRTLDFKKYKPGDTIHLVGFFDKEIYNVKLIFKRKEKIETSLGKFESYVLVPVVPKNKLFRGDHPVTVWVSDDQNKIPLRIKAKLMIGSLDMEIMEAKNLRNN
jgi:hypothetical protein